MKDPAAGPSPEYVDAIKAAAAEQTLNSTSVQALGELGMGGRPFSVTDVADLVVPGSKAARNLARTQSMILTDQASE